MLTSFSATIVGESSLNRGRSTVELVQACLCTSKDLESCFEQFKCSVKLVQATVKHAQTCFSVEMVGESSFHHKGSPVNLVQTCLSTLKKLTKQFSLLWKCCKARADLFQCGDCRRKQF